MDGRSIWSAKNRGVYLPSTNCVGILIEFQRQRHIAKLLHFAHCGELGLRSRPAQPSQGPYSSLPLSRTFSFANFERPGIRDVYSELPGDNELTRILQWPGYPAAVKAHSLQR